MLYRIESQPKTQTQEMIQPLNIVTDYEKKNVLRHTKDTGYDNTSGSYHNCRCPDRGRHPRGHEMSKLVDRTGAPLSVSFVLLEEADFIRCECR